MILSYAQLENIAAATIKDFNNFFFGTDEKVQNVMPSATPIDQFASQYLNLNVSFTRLSVSYTHLTLPTKA